MTFLNINPRDNDYSASEPLRDWLIVALSHIARVLEDSTAMDGSDTPANYACDTGAMALYGIVGKLEEIQEKH